jgi:xylose dehydrogenase (NAD/NADP)
MSASSELRWGILGTATIAPAVIRGVRASRSGVVTAVASRDLAKARAFATAHQIPEAFGSYAELLASRSVDVVYNPLPNTLHAEWTIAALRAGLPVLCEKPFAMTPAEARAVADVARETGLAVAEAFMYRFHPLYDRVRAVIDAGELGALVTIRGQFTFALDDPSALPGQAALGGGALRDVGCYAVDLARQLSRAEPVRAMAFTRSRSRGLDDTLVGALELDSGVLAQLECSLESFEQHRAELAGTEGVIVLDAPWFPGAERGSFLLRRAGHADVVVETPGGDGYALETADFARAVVTHTPPRWPVEDAVSNAAAVDALLASAALGAAVRVEGLDGSRRTR